MLQSSKIYFNFVPIMLFNFFKRKNYHKLTDDELLETYRDSDDHEALGVLYERHLTMVFSTCQRYLEDQASAQDASLDIYEQLIEKIKLHDIQNFENWLFIMTKNHCLMVLRTRKTNVHMPIDDFGHLAASDEKSSEEYASEEGELRSLESCIAQLPEDQKQAITLFYLQEKSYKEVADIMQEDINKVRSFIQNGRRNLKICMGSNERN
jgi:RNA polymerase sigma factor (sigma-70 family)